MKKWMVILLCLALLPGCSAEVLETLGDVEHVSATQLSRRTVALQLPGNAAVLTASGGDTLYICDDYTIALQTLSSGDLNATLQLVSGFEKDRLTVVETACGDHVRYDFVWIAAGENGDQVCRAAVIDDGSYHYCLTVMADADLSGDLTQAWNALFGTFCLA